MHHRHAQTGALTRGFGGVKRLKNAGLHLITHAHAVITDLQRHIVAHIGTKGCAVVEEANLHLTLAPHRIPGIDGQIDQRIFKIATVYLHHPQIVRQHNG